MKIVKNIGVLMSAVLLAAGIGACQAADTATPSSNSALSQIKVAVVNVQQVLQQSPRVAELSKKLEGQFKARQDKINGEQKSLQERIDKFKKDAPTMGQKDRDSTQKSIESDRATLVKEVVAYQQDLQKSQNNIMQGILNDLNGIVSDIAKKDAYLLVLDSQAVIFAADGNDITKDVTKKFNDKK